MDGPEVCCLQLMSLLQVHLVAVDRFRRQGLHHSTFLWFNDISYFHADGYGDWLIANAGIRPGYIPSTQLKGLNDIASCRIIYEY